MTAIAIVVVAAGCGCGCGVEIPTTIGCTIVCDVVAMECECGCGYDCDYGSNCAAGGRQESENVIVIVIGRGKESGGVGAAVMSIAMTSGRVAVILAPVDCDGSYWCWNEI